jgi:transposase-like protein
VVVIQRCTVHKLRNLTAHAPKRLAEEIKADFNDMVYASTATAVAARRKAFLRKWSLKCRAVADSLEEAGDLLFTFTRLPPSRNGRVRARPMPGAMRELRVDVRHRQRLPPWRRVRAAVGGSVC